MREYQLGEIAVINPSLRLKKGKKARKIAMEHVDPFETYIRKWTFDNYKGGTKFQNGDTIMARITPCLENGKCAYVECLDSDEIAFGSTEYLVWRAKPELVDSKFLYYLLNTSEIRDAAIKSMTGSSGRQRVQTDVFASLQVSLPTLPEQRRVAGILSVFDDKIDLLRRQNATLEAMAGAVFREWFVERREDDWEEVLVSDLADHVKDSVKPGDYPDEEFVHYSLPAFDNGQRPVIETGAAIKSGKYRVPPISILVSKLNPRFPRIWWIGQDVAKNAVCSTEFQVVKPKDPAHGGFLLEFLKSRYATDALMMCASGTSGSHQRVRPGDIFGLGVEVQGLSAIKQYGSVNDSWLLKVDKNNLQIKMIDTARSISLRNLIG